MKKNCLVIHPSELYMIYSVGSLLVVKSVDDTPDRFLEGHTGKINYIAVSKQGNLVASGEAHELKSDECAALIVWDFH